MSPGFIVFAARRGYRNRQMLSLRRSQQLLSQFTGLHRRIKSISEEIVRSKRRTDKDGLGNDEDNRRGAHYWCIFGL